MIVKIIQQMGIAVFKLKNDPVVTCNPNRPETFQFAFKRMQAGAGKTKILNLVRCIQKSQDVPYLFNLCSRQAGSIVFSPEQFQALVLYADNHYCKCNL